jgi:transcriptional regulator with XRE-family HTH domain
MTQQALAQSADITQNAIFRIESGETNPQLTTLQQIAAGLGCSVRELLCGIPQSAPYLADRLSRVRAVVESEDKTAISVLDNGIEAAEELIARSRGRRRMPSEPMKRVAKGEGRRSLAGDLIFNHPIPRRKSEADDIPLTTNPEWIKLGGRTSRRPKSTHEAK